MNKATYTGWSLNNFPLSTGGLDFIQTQILLAGMLAKMAGGNYILSGCTVSGTTVAAGYMILNGEVLPFAGGTLQSTVCVKEVSSDITAGSVTYSGAYKTRTVQFGSNVSNSETYNWADIGALPTLASLDTAKATKTALEEVRDLVMPVGAIILWSGAIADIPSGFALCDGSTVNSVVTPNLSGRFVVGYDDDSAGTPANSTDLTENFGKIGNTGGKNNVTLTTSQMPSHQHDSAWGDKNVTGPFGNVPNVTNSYGSASSDFDNNRYYTSASGGGAAHENRPAYYVLAYIMKVI